MRHDVQQAFRHDARVGDGQAQGLQQPAQAVAHLGGAIVELLRQPRHQGHAHGNRLAVRVAGVGGGGLEGVADGMAEIENGAHALLRGVLLHHAHLHRNRTLDERGQGGFVALANRLHAVFHVGEQLGVADGAGLDDFAQPAEVFAFRQRGQQAGIRHHHARRVEGADQVLAERVVDARLAADAAVHHGQKGGGHVDQGDAPHVAGGHEAAQIADDAAAQGEHHALAVRSHARQPGEQPRSVAQRLAALAVRDEARLHLVVGGAQRIPKPFAV